MTNTPQIGLDSPIFSGRLRDHSRPAGYKSRPLVHSKPREITDVVVAQKVYEPIKVVKPKINVEVKKIRYSHIVPVPAIPRQKKSTVLKRQFVTKNTIVHSSEKPTKNKITKHKFHYSSALLTGAALVLFAVGSGVAYLGMKTNHHVQAQVHTLGNAKSQDNQEDAPPDETKPSETAFKSYQVAPSLPRYVRIAKIAVEARVFRQGVDAKGALQAPNNIFNAGWYENSSKPGEAGATLIDGHVSGISQPAVFKNLNKLIVGDTIEIERGDGKLFNYKVVISKTFKVDNVDMASAMVSVDPAKPGLNLITCAGKIVNGNKYDSRLIVYAVQI